MITPLQQQKRRCQDRLLWTVIIFLVLFGAGLTLTSCSHLTVAPRPVSAHVIAFDENKQNAGVIDGDANGLIVTPGWMGRYRAMENKFQETNFEPDNRIKPEGQNYRVSYTVSDHFADLTRRKHLAEGGP